MISASGAVVFITGRNSEKLNQVAKESGISTDRAFEMDIANEASVAATVQHIKNQTTVIDILINATGIGIIKSMDTLTTAEFEQTL
ncbi:SDR family NAD(P)-dependent oxidoreductase, partial [Lacticaseibacillus rhamnosus]|uniref:SDR family NAD(P)-dependent oxidoreductase n=1 Tax=Lacticaseibacillus rhamnosus TaxID=47715 RepID=UPI003F4686A9